MPQSTSDKILARIYGKGRGQSFTPKDFQDLASPENVRAVLCRLAAGGTIRRLRRGVYDYPEHSALFAGPASPDPDAMARAIARSHGWTIVPEGQTALNLLGLSTQVPAHWQFLSDGPSRRIAWTGGTLVFRHRTSNETTRLSPRTALLVQALKALGVARVDAAVQTRLRTAFGAPELARALREARYVTAWVYEILKRLAAAEEAAHA